MQLFSFESITIFLIAGLLAATLIRSSAHRAAQVGLPAGFVVRLAGVVLIWLALAAALSLRGFFSGPRFTAADLPAFILFATAMALPPLGFWALLHVSPSLRRLVEAIPTDQLILIQVFRVGGVVFLSLLAAGRLPLWFGISTAVADLLIGLTAPLVAWGVARAAAWSRSAAIAWSVVGLADFVHALGFVNMAFLGLIAPTPDPVLIGQHPLALISLFQVPLAIILHVLVLRRLLTPAVTTAALPQRPAALH